MRVPQRGRAILRRISAHDTVRAFRPGDFLLTSSDGGLALLTGWATGGAVNHAALIVDPLGTVVEANPSFLTDARAYRLSSAGSYLQAGKQCWIGYVELREGTRQDVVGFADHMVRAHGIVSLSGRLALALHVVCSVAPRARTERHPWLHGLRDFFDSHALVLREEHCYSSGELVARALERGGFIWDRDPAHITPDTLFERYYQPEAAPVAPITPMPLGRARQPRAGSTLAPQHERTGRGAISQFAPRAAHRGGGIRGATALSEVPSKSESPQAGMHALLQLGVMTAAGLAVLGLLEELVHLLGGEL
ncbi:MAG: hypothetical protein ACXWP6_07615 [Ktedonobacterales bacterium]